jgi:hypothetical protein
MRGTATPFELIIKIGMGRFAFQSISILALQIEFNPAYSILKSKTLFDIITCYSVHNFSHCLLLLFATRIIEDQLISKYSP